MKIPKPTDADKERFRSLVPDDPRVEIKAMFGNLAAFVNGNMFMGLFGADVGVRLPEERRNALLAVAGAGPFGPEERPMREYVALPASFRAGPEGGTPWIEEALEHTAALAPRNK